MSITQKRIQELLSYDSESGVFTRRVHVGKRWKAGSVAGTVNGQGYAQLKVDGKIYQAHRLAWLYVRGSLPVGEIDHIHADKTDNRIENLRDVSGSVNCQNLRMARGLKKSQPLGVTIVSRDGASRPFRARIEVGGKAKSLGCYESADAAEKAYVIAKRQLHAGCTI